MFYVSEVMTEMPKEFKTTLQKETYEVLKKLNIPFERVDTDEAITIEDCIPINEKLNMKMVKTLFLCNQKKTMFYLFITTGDKSFNAKVFGKAMGVSRVSFAPEELMDEILGVKVGAATVFSTIIDKFKELQIVIDKDVADEEYYGCSDGTTTCYMKIKTKYIVDDFLNYVRHKPTIIEM